MMAIRQKHVFLLLDGILFHVIFIGEVQERHSKYARASLRSPKPVFRACFENQQNAQRSKSVGWQLKVPCVSTEPTCFLPECHASLNN